MIARPTKGKVLVAMSGGVDSSVAAALLQRDGYEVVGCFMRLGSPGESLDALIPYEEAAACPAPNSTSTSSTCTSEGRTIRIGHQGCCSINDAADARAVAAQLGVAFYVCNFKKDFGRIIDYFAGEYASGRTPNPCVRCNDWLKFGKLHDYAKQIGADFVASGHYARIGRDAQGHATLLKGIDGDKDQSYVLFGASRDRLQHMMLPIGGLEKPRVRELAKAFGLPVFDKPDSQEICFVPDNDYAGLLEKRDPALAREGKFVDTSGRAVGTHEGQHQFTIGQRRGLNLALGYPVYVVNKDASTNTVVVGPKEALGCESCTCAEANWLVDVSMLSTSPGPESAKSLEVDEDWFPVLAKYRYNTPAALAHARILPNDTISPSPSGRAGAFEVRFDSPQEAVAPGQALVLYSRESPDLVLGGGWISKVTAAAAAALHP
ncbi:MAG: tRNA 2-thiouridine(34) synthase MnmA [Phycisphaeraceae bacterium]|nr:tRNA 2-thiouridine(34) synthase MnmA [Phycisphaeraceae bacterium]